MGGKWKNLQEKRDHKITNMTVKATVHGCWSRIPSRVGEKPTDPWPPVTPRPLIHRTRPVADPGNPGASNDG